MDFARKKNEFKMPIANPRPGIFKAWKQMNSFFSLRLIVVDSVLHFYRFNNLPLSKNTLSYSASYPLLGFCSSVSIVNEMLFSVEMNGISSDPKQSYLDLNTFLIVKLSHPHSCNSAFGQMPRHTRLNKRTSRDPSCPVIFHEHSMSFGKSAGQKGFGRGPRVPSETTFVGQTDEKKKHLPT